MLQQHYMEKPKWALKSLKREAKTPPFLQSLWETVLLNQYVDFSKLNAIQRAKVPDEQVVLTSGRLQFTINEIQGKESIKTQGAWLAAYECYSDAIIFAYPH